MRLLALLLCCLLSGCTYATGSVSPDGTMQFSYIRPWLEKRQMEFSYDPTTKEVHIAVESDPQHLPWKEIGSFVGAAIATGVKTGVGIP